MKISSFKPPAESKTLTSLSRLNTALAGTGIAALIGLAGTMVAPSQVKPFLSAGVPIAIEVCVAAALWYSKAAADGRIDVGDIVEGIKDIGETIPGAKVLLNTTEFERLKTVADFIRHGATIPTSLLPPDYLEELTSQIKASMPQPQPEKEVASNGSEDPIPVIGEPPAI